MPINEQVSVKDLTLDLKNFRTVSQTNENAAVEAMIQISPDWFWALTESLIQDGYLPTENIIVLETPQGDKIVKEGNRRVAAMKIIHGHISKIGLTIPAAQKASIGSISTEWLANNEKAPCLIYPASESATVDKIVRLTHGKGEKAGRDKWTAVASARHNRDVFGASEPGLTLLEAYLKHGKNITTKYAERWAGDYPLSVLDKAMPFIAPKLGLANAVDLATAYPSVSYKDELETILHDIGLRILKTEGVRYANADFATKKYGIPAVPVTVAMPTTASPSGGASSSPATPSEGTGATGPTVTDTSATAAPRKTAAAPVDDPRTVEQTLKRFKIVGANRSKVVTLREEALHLDLTDNRIAFCFLLRSMFEISAKAYCSDLDGTPNAIATVKDGVDRPLREVLKDITNVMTNKGKDKIMLKVVHGALTEIARSDGLLSITSMNQLVHSPTFMLSTRDICILFGSVFPLLQEMNK